MSGKSGGKLTAGDHRANRLQKQLDGHRRLIAELQEALRDERARAWRLESELEATRIARDLARGIARKILDGECRDSTAWNCWIHRWPGILLTDEELAERREALAVPEKGGG